MFILYIICGLKSAFAKPVFLKQYILRMYYYVPHLLKNVWQKPIQFHKAIIVLVKNKLKKKRKTVSSFVFLARVSRISSLFMDSQNFSETETMMQST